jgi:NAD(P)-dependent dehydrogenase (short-subunit alcohol dehydrogenase family)
MSIKSDTVFIVSGGARGITGHCVVAMAQRFGCRFILLGRTDITQPEPAWAVQTEDRQILQKHYIEYATTNRANGGNGAIPHPQAIRREIDSVLARSEIQSTIQHAQAAGGQATYFSVDVTNQHQLGETLKIAQRQVGRVTGLLHGAGNLADKRIENKTVPDFEHVYGAKVEGLKNLLTCLPPEQLSYLILFSSAAAFYGNVGQADYAMSNEILNKVAHYMARTYPDCQVHALNWGPWDSGMVTAEVKEVFARQGIETIPVEAGTKMLISVLEQSDASTQTVIGGSLPSLKADPGDELLTHHIRRRIIPDASPALKHHRIGKHVVLPMLHALNWLASTCEDLYPGYRFFRSEDFKVLKGIVFDEQLAPEYALELRETVKNTDQITFECLVHSHTQDNRPRYHYRARLTLRREVPEAPTYPVIDLSAYLAIDADEFYRNGTLFHGPYFQGIRRVYKVNPEMLVAECVSLDVPEQEQGQFTTQAIDPFTCDMMMQAAVIWVRDTYGAASLPLSCAMGEQYQLIPKAQPFFVSLNVQQTSENLMGFDLTAHDAEGKVYARVFNAQVTVSRQLNQLFQAYEG